jgi:tetratricopeptide (TPR) repeat protein
MRTFTIGFFLLLSYYCFGQVSVVMGLHCGTKNQKALEYFNSANFGMQTNRLKAAALIYTSAIKLDSTFCDAWDNLAVCFRKLGLYNEAFRASVHSLMIDSTNVTAWANCGNIALLQNDIPKALKSYDNLQRIVPGNPEGYYGKSLALYSIDSLVEAKNNFVKAEQAYKTNHLKIGNEVYLIKGFIEFKTGNKIEAQRIFEKIYSNFKDNPELNYFLGKCVLENENDGKKSQKYIDKALKLGYVIETKTNNSIKR